MATTFKDFIIECELYPYSRENFEFMKECSEIALTEKFINDQIFMSEANEFLKTDTIEFEDNFFQESVDNSSLEVLTEKFKIKSNNIIGKMLSRIFKIFNVFSKFFGKIGNKFDPITKKGQEVLSMIKKVTFDDEKLAKVKEIINNAKSNESTAFPIKINQPYSKHIKLNYGGHDRDIVNIKDGLAVALSDNKVVAEALFADANDKNKVIDEKRIGIMDPDELYNIGITLCVGKEGAIMNSAKSLYNSWLHVRKNGLVIDVNTKNINKTAEKLDDVCKKLNELGSSIATEVGQSYSSADRKSVV